jgi:hypothetical protein
VNSPIADPRNRQHRTTDRRDVRTLSRAAAPWAATVARLLVGGVFLVAGAVELPDRAHEDWARQVTDAASRAGLAGTPTVLIDGEQLDLRQASPQGLEAAVCAAAAG